MESKTVKTHRKRIEWWLPGGKGNEGMVKEYKLPVIRQIRSRERYNVQHGDYS